MSSAFIFWITFCGPFQGTPHQNIAQHRNVTRACDLTAAFYIIVSIIAIICGKSKEYL